MKRLRYEHLAFIRQKWLVRRKRHHVHLSATRETAQRVGTRHGQPVVLIVEAARMHADGHQFFLSADGVWLTECVPVGYIQWPEGESTL